MKNINKIVLSLTFLFFLYSCGGMSDAGKVLRNEKIKNADEFLVKKREPLILPPDYNEIPEPNSQEKNDRTEDKNRIKKILSNSEKETTSKKSSSTEKSILNRIKK